MILVPLPAAGGERHNIVCMHSSKGFFIDKYIIMVYNTKWIIILISVLSVDILAR